VRVEQARVLGLDVKNHASVPDVMVVPEDG
jgi:hypothetical protein